MHGGPDALLLLRLRHTNALQHQRVCDRNSLLLLLLRRADLTLLPLRRLVNPSLLDRLGRCLLALHTQMSTQVSRSARIAHARSTGRAPKQTEHHAHHSTARTCASILPEASFTSVMLTLTSSRPSLASCVFGQKGCKAR